MRTRRSDPNLPPLPWPALSVVLLGVFLGPLGGLIVGIALPSIARDFRISIHDAKLILVVYWLVTTFLVPVCGHIGKRFGPVRLFILGLLIDGLGTLVCALAPTDALPVMLAGRVVQGFGSAVMFALFGALITRVVPAQRRGLAFGLAGATVALSLTVAPILGGILLEYYNWRAVFFVQLPLHALATLLGLRRLPRDPLGLGEAFPVANALAWLTLTSGFTLVTEAYSRGLWLAWLPLFFGIALCGLVAFIWLERRGQPLIAWQMFGLPQVRYGMPAMLLSNLAMFAMLFLMPFHLEDYLGLEPRQRGLILGLAPLATLLISPWAGHLSDRRGPRLPVLGGLVLAAAGYALLARGVGGSLNEIRLGMLVLGCANGLFYSPLSSAMMGAAGPGLQAAVSSMTGLMRNVGFLSGTSLATLWLSMFIGLHAQGGAQMQQAVRSSELAAAVPLPVFSWALAGVLWICSGLLALAALINLRLPDRVSEPGVLQTELPPE